MTNEIWTKLSDEELHKRVSSVTREVKFYFLDYYNTKHQPLEGEWLGEVLKTPFSFKLYKILNAKDTNEFCIKGKVVERGAGRVIVFKMGFGFACFFEFLGMTTFPFVLLHFLYLRGYHDIKYLGAIAGLAAMSFFFVRLMSRYAKAINQFKDLVS